MFQGRRSDFLPRQVVRRAEAISTTSASLKRMREIDEDVDLYGEEETPGKRRRGEATDELRHDGGNIEFAEQFAPQATETMTREKLEWLLFLVSEEGGLQVLLSSAELTIDSTIK